jgi:RNA polymerase sigma-70 factor (ECF subfamily)
VTDPADTPGQALERFRAYLHLVARSEVSPFLQGKLDVSGVVQQTLFEAHRDWDEVRSLSAERQGRWLRRLLAHNLTDEIRRLRAQGRDVRREVSLDAALEQSSARLAAILRQEGSSPSTQLQREEESFRLAEALARLPEAERDAIVLQQWHGWTLAQIAGRLGRTPGAVAGLLHRGLRRLKTLLDNEADP